MSMRQRAYLGLVVAAVVVAAAAVASAAVAPTQSSITVFLPDVESAGPPVTATSTREPGATPTFGGPMPTRRPLAAPQAVEPQGIEGWGNSTLELQSLSLAPAEVDLTLKPQQGGNIHVQRSLPGLGAVRVDVVGLPGIQQAFYRGDLVANQPFTARVRTTWHNGGVADYEAPDVSDELILPLFARAVISHTTIFYVYNVDQGSEANRVRFDIFDPATGDPTFSWSSDLQPGAVSSWDSYYDDVLFSRLGDDYLGTLHVSSREPVAMMAYGEEMAAHATSAYEAVAVAKLSARQVLPVVRSGTTAGSLIAVANPSYDTVSVHGVFTPAVWRPGAETAVDFTIAPKATTFFDLTTLNRGNVARPGVGNSFEGALVLEATAPIAAVAHDTSVASGDVVASSTYNSFSDGDLAQSAVVSTAFGDGRQTTIYVANPATIAASVDVAYGPDGSLGVVHREVPRQSVVKIVAADAGLSSSTGPVSALVTSDLDVAVMSYTDGYAGTRDGAFLRAVPVPSGDPVIPTATHSPTPTTPPALTPSATVPTAVRPPTPHLYLPYGLR